jgi:hypothetical protein
MMHECEEVRGGNGASVLCLGLGESEREREAEAGVKPNAASWCSRGPLGPDRWARDWRTGTMACPHGGHGLRLVGHCRTESVSMG